MIRSHFAHRMAFRMMLPALAFTLLALVAASPAPAPATRKVVPDIRNSPGYVPLNDPDSLDEVLGRRRNAPLVSAPFHGSYRSLKALGDQVCRLLHSGRPDSMLALCVSREEFRIILWPEFPQSRPATGLRWDDAWPILYGRLNGGSVACVREYGESEWTLLGVEYQSLARYRNFRLYNEVTLTARSEEGKVQTLTFIRSVAERKGRFLIYSMRD